MRVCLAFLSDNKETNMAGVEYIQGDEKEKAQTGNWGRKTL